MTLGHVSSTSFTWAFNFGIKLLGVDNLIHFESADIASIYSNLDAWSDIGHSGDDTSASNESSDLVGTDVTHSADGLLGVGSVHNEHLVGTFKFRG